MKLIELHILQSYPVTCLNRDDVGSPKSAIFGGTPRSRLSSQCLKRAIREYATELLPQRFGGKRTKLIVEPIAQRLREKGYSAEEALSLAVSATNAINKYDEDKAKKNDVHMAKTLVFLSPNDFQVMADAAAEVAEQESDEKKRVTLINKAIPKALKQVQLIDAADIAIFGRMVANDASLNIEGAGMFSHALSTHRCDSEIDFYSAVDDDHRARQLEDDNTDAGAGMIGTLEFNSATYYRFAAINLDLLWNRSHLGGLEENEQRQVLESFLKAALLAVPNARTNSMNGHTLPGYVLGVVKDHGQPVQLINAFEKAAHSNGGYLEASRELLKSHFAELKNTWGIETVAEAELPGQHLNDFLQTLLEAAMAVPATT